MPTARLLLFRCCRLSRCRPQCRCRLCLGFFLLTLLLALQCAWAAQVSQPKEIIKFRMRDGYLMIVQARVNGAGPFSFLLDTGTTRTVIDPELALQLQAPVIGSDTLAIFSSLRRVRLVHLDDVQVGNAKASDLGVMVDKINEVKFLAPGIRGVLGEDFLSRFDILIDYKKRWLSFGDSAPDGERSPVRMKGQYRGLPTSNRLLIKAEFMDTSGGELELQLDTGARRAELFPVSHESLSSQPWGGVMAVSGGSKGITIHSRITMRIGTTIITDLDVIQSHRGVAYDAAGLLPASIFHRVYISHSGGFVVLNPVERKAKPMPAPPDASSVMRNGGS